MDEGTTTVPDAVIPASAAPGMGRRELFRRGGMLAAGAAAGGLLWKWRGPVLDPFRAEVADAAVAAMPLDSDIYIGGTDGWIKLPDSPTIPIYHPDTYAPAPYNCYIFGFRNITDLSDQQRADQKNHAQYMAPLFWVDEYDETKGVTPKDHGEFRLSITNLGLAQRPDLFDAHTLHWHGFRNVIPFFDGEPAGSVSVPGGALFTYVYRPRDPGTYMYHCHVEDTEHVHMGMTGMVFVRPKQNGTPLAWQGKTFTKFAYNDGDGNTGYDREFSLLLTEVWAEAHWDDAHIQLPDWTDYRVDFALINGRTYPDTLAPNAPLDGRLGLPYHPYQVAASGDLESPLGHPELNRQPMSALVECNAGESVLLRIANLGFTEAAMTTTGLRMRVVGRDATPMKGRDGTDTSYSATTLTMGPGESFDVIVDAPAYTGNGTDPDVYLLYNRILQRADHTAGGTAGQMTEIHVYPPNTFKAQDYPNHSDRNA